MAQEGVTRDVLLRAMDLLLERPFIADSFFPKQIEFAQREIEGVFKIPKSALEDASPYGFGPAINSPSTYHHFHVECMTVMQEEKPGIGDHTCANNALSPHLRCAVNPCGPCEGCKFYE